MHFIKQNIKDCKINPQSGPRDFNVQEERKKNIMNHVPPRGQVKVHEVQSLKNFCTDVKQ